MITKENFQKVLKKLGFSNENNRELDNLDVPALTKIFEKVKKLLAQKKKAEKPFARQLGGLEKGFYMASDFDDTPECFKEYM